MSAKSMIPWGTRGMGCRGRAGVHGVINMACGRTEVVLRRRMWGGVTGGKRGGRGNVAHAK